MTKDPSAVLKSFKLLPSEKRFPGRRWIKKFGLDIDGGELRIIISRETPPDGKERLFLSVGVAGYAGLPLREPTDAEVKRILQPICPVPFERFEEFKPRGALCTRHFAGLDELPADAATPE